eukprot:1156942-Ditylum_brightwellii.AAC.1
MEGVVRRRDRLSCYSDEHPQFLRFVGTKDTKAMTILWVIVFLTRPNILAIEEHQLLEEVSYREEAW